MQANLSRAARERIHICLRWSAPRRSLQSLTRRRVQCYDKLARPGLETLSNPRIDKISRSKHRSPVFLPMNRIGNIYPAYGVWLAGTSARIPTHQPHRAPDTYSRPSCSAWTKGHRKPHRSGPGTRDFNSSSQRTFEKPHVEF